MYRYLNDLNAKTSIVENKYIDKDYLIDFSKFYSRSYEIDQKFTTRLHFFSESFSYDDFKKVLIEGDEEFFKTIQASYLGFVVVKPIKNSKGEKLIGRTVLSTYPHGEGDEKRYFLKNLHHASLFGIPLEIESLPFQTQDTAVGACATSACWISLDPLSNLFGIQKYSPYEVTEMSVFFPSLSRNFPSEGLTLLQIKNHFNSIGLDTEFININEIINTIPKYNHLDDVVADAVRAYSKIGLPIIAGIGLRKETKNTLDYHAVVISGYRQNDGDLKQLYVHDDQIGPYSRVKPIGNFIKWDNEWLQSYSEINVETLIIPIYPKLRLSFIKIYTVFIQYKRKIESINLKFLEESEGLASELYLVELKNYKKFLWKHSLENKEKILLKDFPRFLWVVRIHFKGTPIVDYVYDGTSVLAREVCNIKFKY